MRKLLLFSIVVHSLAVCFGEAALPHFRSVNLLPARAPAITCESAALALAVAKGEKSAGESSRFLSLNGAWNIRMRSPDGEGWTNPRSIEVPFSVPRPAGEGGGRESVEALCSRDFTLPGDWPGRRTVLCFGGVQSAITVRVNGREIGSKLADGLPAEFDISSHVAAGQNTVDVEISAWDADLFAAQRPGLRLFGLYRDVWLVSERREHPHALEVKTFLSDDLHRGTVKVTDGKGAVLFEKSYDRPLLWSSENPNLYYETIRLDSPGLFSSSEYRTVSFGFRSLGFDGDSIKLNGRPLVLNGVDRVELEPASGMAVTAEGERNDIEILRRLNINAVYAAGEICSQRWYDLCDRFGIYVLHDASTLANPKVQKLLAAHPSVLPAGVCTKFPGGFGVDFADQAIWVECEGFNRLKPGQRVRPALVAADRSFHPLAWETKHRFRPVRVSSFDWETGVARIRNDFAFTAMDGIRGMWKADCQGRTIAKGLIDLSALGPHSSIETLVNAAGADAVLFAFGRPGRGEPFAHDQFVKPAAKTFPAVHKASASASDPTLSGRFRLNLWRAKSPREQNASMAQCRRFWREATEANSLDGLVESKLSARRLEGGEIALDFSIKLLDGAPAPARMGISFSIPGNLTNVVWYGMGPWENYADCRDSAMLGVFGANIDLNRGVALPGMAIARDPNALNSGNYLEPGEEGYRTLCRWVEFSDGKGAKVRIAGNGASFAFNAWPCSQESIERAAARENLVREKDITVNIDALDMAIDRPVGARTAALGLIIGGL